MADTNAQTSVFLAAGRMTARTILSDVQLNHPTNKAYSGNEAGHERVLWALVTPTSATDGQMS